ncbi:hypothetical protein FKM82_022875 [Ascaphus truei]
MFLYKGSTLITGNAEIALHCVLCNHCTFCATRRQSEILQRSSRSLVVRALPWKRFVSQHQLLVTWGGKSLHLPVPAKLEC